MFRISKSRNFPELYLLGTFRNCTYSELSGIVPTCPPPPPPPQGARVRRDLKFRNVFSSVFLQVPGTSTGRVDPLLEQAHVKNTLDTGTLETLKLRVQVPGRVEVGEEKTPLPAPRHRV